VGRGICCKDRLPSKYSRLLWLDVGVLSNLLQFVHGRGSDDPPALIRPARPDEIPTAVTLILIGSGAPVEDHHLEEFLAQAPTRGIDLSRLWIAEQAGRITTAALPVQSPGRTMLIFAPRVSSRSQEAVMSRLIDAACRDGSQRDIHLAQVLFEPTDESLQRIYTAAGFIRMAELLYLHSTPRSGTPQPTLPTHQRLLCYGTETHTLFARTILATYQDSLDCPALNGLRDIEDIIDGHKASGQFDPSMWFLLLENDTPQGVLLLACTAAQAVELVYLGLTPAGRGRHIGEFLMKHSMAVTARTHTPRLTLAVDSRNTPALKLYYRSGLSRVDAKLAYMRDLRRG
jgi:mycothiol synthase